MKHIEADVVLVGGGMSGLCAATQAQESLNATGGGSVVVFEKSGTIGGAANMGMAFFAVESQLQKETMTNDYTKDDAFNFFMEYTHWRSDAKLVRRWFNMSGDTVKWMQDKGVEFLGVFKYFKNSKATQHMVKLPGSNKPTERCASVMIKTVTEYAREIGVEFNLNTPVKQLLTGSKGQARGVIAVGEDGEEIECLANAVIVTTGGIGNNVEMIEKHMGWKWGVDMFTFRIPGLDGDGMNMLWALGAKQANVNMEVTYNTPGTTDVFKTLSETMRQPNLMVNLDGKRFINEAIMDNTTYTGNSLLLQKKHMGISIIDSTIVDYYKKNGLDYITYHHGITNLDNWEREKELYFSGAQSAGGNSVFASEDKEVSYGADSQEHNFFGDRGEDRREPGEPEEDHRGVQRNVQRCSGWLRLAVHQARKVPQAPAEGTLLCSKALPFRLRLPGWHSGQREHAGSGHRAVPHARLLCLRHRHRYRVR